MGVEKHNKKRFAKTIVSKGFYKKSTKIQTRFFLDFSDTAGLHSFFGSVFQLPSLRNTRKRDKTKNRGKTDIETFADCFGKSFRRGLFVHISLFLWCF
jgi:hypothetical protein